MDELRRDFGSPPQSAWARTLWFWVNGNITREGITADLEAMRRVGIGGVSLFSVGRGLPEGPVGFLTPQWMELLQHAMNEAARLGLEFGVHHCDGFSEGGGPWITPELAMKKLVWTETRVSGGNTRELVLPQPESVRGFYRDVAVVAFPAPPGENASPAGDMPKVRSSIAGFDARAVLDENRRTISRIPATSAERGEFIEFEFPTERVVRSLVLESPGSAERGQSLFPATLLASDDGKSFRRVAAFNPKFMRDHTTIISTTVSFDAVRARFFRLEFKNHPELDLASVRFLESPRVHYWELKAGLAREREHGGETFALRGPGGPQRELHDLAAPAAHIPDTDRVLDLARQLSSGGKLRWDAPAGEWIVLRLGYTLTEARNGSATPLGVGLECDKLDPRGVEARFANYVGRLVKEMGPLVPGTFAFAASDSWEVGLQTWTDAFATEFKRRRGYDLLPFFPVLTSGRVIGSYERSERFLWDYRRTVADMIREYYYDRARALFHERGLKYLAEGAGRQQYLYDPINYLAPADIPEGEFWVPANLREDNRAAASTAHIYNKPLVGGEAFTGSSRWAKDPFALKPLGDRAFCSGVNYFLLHRYVHQPWIGVAPGMVMGAAGTEFERTNTWWDISGDWFSYLARCQYLLRQGQFVADVCHFLGDDVPNFIGHRENLWLPLPAGHDFDGCNAEILERFGVRDGRLVLPHGQSYRVLLLSDQRTIRPAAMRKIHDLVRDGAVVVGPKPTRSPSLENYPACDEEVRRLADAVWGNCDGVTVKEHGVGKGRVFWGKSWNEIFASIDTPADFAYSTVPAGSEVNYIHRRIGDTDLYFVASNAGVPIEADCLFRVDGQVPEFWHPDTGRIEQPALFEFRGGRTRVPLRFEPYESRFVVFRPATTTTPRHFTRVTRLDADAANRRATNYGPEIVLRNAVGGRAEARVTQAGRYELQSYDGRTRIVEATRLPTVIEITGPWAVRFPHPDGTFSALDFRRLESWTKSDTERVRFFSGTAIYEKEIEIPAGMLGANRMLYLDLGTVKNLAEVKLNGRDLGVLWKAPWKVEITSAARPGRNELEVRITNLLVNRLIGDAHLPEENEWQPNGSRWAGKAARNWPAWVQDPSAPRQRQTFAAFKHWTKADSPLESGLIGPVKLRPAIRIQIQ